MKAFKGLFILKIFVVRKELPQFIQLNPISENNKTAARDQFGGGLRINGVVALGIFEPNNVGSGKLSNIEFANGF